MDIQTILILLAIGLGAGILGGMVGIGGGIIIVPALVYFMQYSQLQAQGTSLGIILLPTGIFAFLQYYNHCIKAGTPINFSVIACIALGFLIGGYFGSKIAVKINQDLLKKIFAIFIILVALKMLFLDKPKKQPIHEELKAKNI